MFLGLFLNIFIDLDHTVAAKSVAVAIDSEPNKETIHTAFLTLLGFIKYDEAFDLVFAGASAASAYEFCMHNHDKETT